MLHSTLLTVSASAILWLSRLNNLPRRIVVYASQPPSPTTTQHSLPGARYGLPGPDFHRLDRASLPGAQAIHSQPVGRMDCFVAALLAMTTCDYFFTSGQRDSSSDWNASLPGIVASSL